MMVIIDPKLYRKFFTYDSKGVALLYIEINKAMYGLLKSSLLLYKQLLEDI